jgi:hypothetical protein
MSTFATMPRFKHATRTRTKKLLQFSKNDAKNYVAILVTYSGKYPTLPERRLTCGYPKHYVGTRLDSVPENEMMQFTERSNMSESSPERTESVPDKNAVPLLVVDIGRHSSQWARDLRFEFTMLKSLTPAKTFVGVNQQLEKENRKHRYLESARRRARKTKCRKALSSLANSTVS